MANENIRQRIEDSKIITESKLAISKVAARKLILANEELIEAEEYRDSKGNSKSAAKQAVAESAYSECLKDFISFFMVYESRVDRTLSLYDELIATEKPKEAKKMRIEAERFEANQSCSKDAIWEIVGTISGVAEAYDAAVKARTQKDAEEKEPEYNERLSDNEKELISEEEPTPAHVPEAEPHQNTAPKREEANHNHPPHQNINAQYGASGYMPYGVYNPYYPPQNVSIAPASVDISPIIEDAVNTAMKKFKILFDRHADELSAAEASAIVTTDKIVKSESEIAEAEGAIASKLAEITVGLKKLADDLAVVADSCEKLIETEKDVAERQRRVNDMQRTLVREMQGVQANQKVILGEQSALIEAQTALAELQSANAENHKLILSAENEVMDMQKSLLEAQTAIGESVREVVNSHKSIVAAEQAIITANSKNIEHQQELSKRQSELSTLQKSIMSEHKALARKVQAQSKSEQ